ncbi:sterol desaturase family protein [Limnoraphis robusta Tam1]|uniref:Sterol desaturase family protein n=1 Tax=Limnoraphis robusta CCNP1315 TaxID=3110306 RepID=A0ABU5TVF7_9CYAN|nr:sterol desaturase family protein [Limnoraphis robusta]MEA5517948.1 sterol desaturase family protein [Limnoraphis robusta CCNP1315]MEA5539000.1 sterol desaturase family protein [Limnoraphis robusta Tam1]MEA5543711.1 sterol desaturase family protein [Limnoraphis robusta CCNP1324]
MEWLAAPIGFIKYLLTAFVMYGLFIVVERVHPAEPRQPLRHLWFNLRWYVLYSLIILLIRAAGIGSIVTLTQGWLNAPYIAIPAPRSLWEYIGVGLLYLGITDFFYYWFHRCQHTKPFLWEQHKFHHSEVSLNVTSTQRVHWLEDPLILLFLSVPMGILFQFEGLEIGILAFIQVLWLQFIHMNLRLELGWFSPLITGPQHHRIHHSFQEKHLDKNFAAFFPFWDILFGTYYRPRKGEFPATGLATGENYNNLWVALMLPLREWSGPRYFKTWMKKIAFHKSLH